MENGSAKFVQSKEKESFGFHVGYILSGGFNSHVGNHLRRRVRGVIEGGLVELWTKWERLREIFHSPKVNTVCFMPLSLEKSDVIRIFALYGICV